MSPIAMLTSHEEGSVLEGTTVRFAWESVEGAEAYRLLVGNTEGDGSLADVAAGTTTEHTVDGLPDDGRPLVVRLMTCVGSDWHHHDYTVRAADATDDAAVSGPGYTEDSIVVLEGIDHVRIRPSMYIGDTGTRGLHHLVYEVVDNAIDEAMAGVCDTITVIIGPDGSVSVEDNGRGFPTGIKQEFGMSALELCLTKLNAGGKFSRDSYKVSGGLHGVGVSVVNALSTWLNVRTARDGQRWTMAFERGRTTEPLAEAGQQERSGTIVHFMPDDSIFRETEFHYDVLAKRLRELAYLNAGITITLTDQRADRSETFHFEQGLRQFVEHLNNGKTALHQPVTVTREDFDQRLICDIAFQYTDGYSELALSFANNINTVEGGTHLSGFRAALTRVMNNYARKQNLYKSNDPVPSGDDIREGMTAVISVKVPEPQFEGQTKTKLGNSEVGTFIETTTHEVLGRYLEEHPSEAKKLVGKAVQAAQAREAARKARETARKTAVAGGGLSRKLVDCSSRDVESTELFIVEGDSAAGSAKGHRDAKTQAILPIRGKILNVEKARLHKILGHEEIVEIIKALGTGIGREDFDISKLRYGKIIIMTDADVDGSHIRTLLLTFLFRHLRPLIEAERVFIAQPPLFGVFKGKQKAYVLDEGALARRLTDQGLSSCVLEIRPEGAEVTTIEGDDLGALLKLLSEVERHAQVLGRRGILFEPFITEHLRDGHLPRVRVTRQDDERFFATSAEADAFVAEQVGDDAERRAPLLRHDLPETEALEACFTRLQERGLSVDDLFHKREELITGELSPARFVIVGKEGKQRELDNLRQVPEGVQAVGSAGWDIRRFKGLGEMNKEELWETTMDPDNRVLRKVLLGEGEPGAAQDPEQDDIDAAEADRIFSILMGENVESRRGFIEENAIHVKNLDV